MTFSATDAAFEGFRVVRRRPAVIAWWSLAYFVFFAALIVAVGGPMLALMPQLEAMGSQPDPSMMGPIMALYGTVFLIALPLSIIFSAVLNAAVARSVLTPEASRFGYIRLGMDEVRVGVVSLVLGILFFLAFMVAAVLAGGIGGAIYAANGVAGVLVGVLVGLAAFVAVIWLAVRLSLAVPITVAENRIAIFDSFKVTKGRFWPLLGMAVLATLMFLLVALLGSILMLPFQLLGGGMAFDQAIQSGDQAAVMAAIGPGVVIGLIVNLIISTLQIAVLYCPFSAAYVALVGRRDATSAVFE